MGNILTKAEILFKELFGKYLPGGYDKNGVFIPGDILNRIKQAQEWIILYNVQGKYNPIILKRLLSIPSGWQNKTQNYLRSLSSANGIGFSFNLWEIGIIGAIIYYITRK